MVHARNTRGVGLFAGAVLFLLASSAVQGQEQDPPYRVARLNYINGSVSMQVPGQGAGESEWAPAELNRPFTTGDGLYVDAGGAAEMHLDVAAIRIGSQTTFGFLNLDDRTVQLKLTEGDLYVRVHNLSSDQVFEVDTPSAAVNLLRDGAYRFHVDPNGSMSYVVVREGQAEITGNNVAFTLDPHNGVALSGSDRLAFQVEPAPQPDAFEEWCRQRDASEAELRSARYLPSTVVGYEDLDSYGSWQEESDYGPVWYPRSVEPGWAPYQYGHWTWINPWGWTWVDSAAWGFAPFHYGRWAYIGNRWGWCPGPIARGGLAVRPYYAPALVAWFGGAHWSAGISIGGGPSLGWVPLGWGEVYTPAYRCTPRYFNNVNVYNTRIVKTVNITNVYNTVYVNKTVYRQTLVNVRAPHAVTAMPEAAFASGRAVRQAAIAVRQPEMRQMESAAVRVPPVTPTPRSFAPISGRPVPRPAEQVAQRQVLARSTPPARQTSATAQQPYASRQTGRSGVPDQAAGRSTPNVRQVRAETAAPARAGERVGTAPGSARPNQPAAENPRGMGVEPRRPASPTGQATRNDFHTAAPQPVPSPPVPSQPATQQPAPFNRNAGPAYRPTSPQRQPTNPEQQRSVERSQPREERAPVRERAPAPVQSPQPRPAPPAAREPARVPTETRPAPSQEPRQAVRAPVERPAERPAAQPRQPQPARPEGRPAPEKRDPRAKENPN